MKKTSLIVAAAIASVFVTGCTAKVARKPQPSAVKSADVHWKDRIGPRVEKPKKEKEEGKGLISNMASYFEEETEGSSS